VVDGEKILNIEGDGEDGDGDGFEVVVDWSREGIYPNLQEKSHEESHDDEGRKQDVVGGKGGDQDGQYESPDKDDHFEPKIFPFVAIIKIPQPTFYVRIFHPFPVTPQQPSKKDWYPTHINYKTHNRHDNQFYIGWIAPKII